MDAPLLALDKESAHSTLSRATKAPSALIKGVGLQDAFRGIWRHFQQVVNPSIAIMSSYITDGEIRQHPVYDDVKRLRRRAVAPSEKLQVSVVDH
jgi:hypothetical protein